MEGMRVEGLFGLVVLAVDVWAIIHIVQSTTSTAKKALWVVLILLLPLLGFLIWLLAGPRKKQANA
ncbi:MAG: PLDc N-terminal domain-containing protein [Rhodospirillales bacterium]|jgi:succinate dehydrogenase/fumarate reductase cytochrome b subunit|nr:PLDc N-terminal domain-containing protein [Rhodospirillales bacterium]